jgi:calcium-independent phospholipase A2-gamma
MVWEAIRASSAAPSYFDELLRRGDKLIDGGIIANNPTAIAIAEAKALWPDVPIDLVLSAGTGIRPRGPVENTNQPFVVSVAVSMLESATETEKYV